MLSFGGILRGERLSMVFYGSGVLSVLQNQFSQIKNTTNFSLYFYIKISRYCFMMSISVLQHEVNHSVEDSC